MKRDNLEKFLGKYVKVVLYDNKQVEGVLHKTQERQFINVPNLYLPYNYYFCYDPVSCLLFRCSHVIKVTIIPGK